MGDVARASATARPQVAYHVSMPVRVPPPWTGWSRRLAHVTIGPAQAYYWTTEGCRALGDERSDDD